MIKAVIFDCFGVLTSDTWRVFLDSLPASVDIGNLKALNRQYDTGLISREVYLGQIHAATGHEPQEVEATLDNEPTKNTILLSYIAGLRKEGLKIGLLSNVATNWITKTFLNSSEQQLFDDMIFSYQVGITKPDSRAYLLACERLGVLPEQAVFTDDIPAYCEAARTCGLTALVYRDFHEFRASLEAILYRA